VTVGTAVPRRVGTDMKREDWRRLLGGLFKFLLEEAREPEHAEDDQPGLATEPSAAIPAAGVMLIDPARRVLFVRRAAEVDHPGTWCFPGGVIEPGETPAACAARETREETGYDAAVDDLRPVDRRELDGVNYLTHAYRVPEAFEPRLDDENDAHTWAPWGEWPEPLHPGVRATLDKLGDEVPHGEGTAASDATGDPNDAPNAEMAMDPLTDKGREIMAAMKKEYGETKGERVFYASRNAGRIKGVDGAPWRDHRWPGANDAASNRLAQDRSPDLGTVYDPRDGLAYLRLAFDLRSVRSKDVDGRLHVKVAHISKATVNPYYGWEIPNAEELGLDREKRYRLLRDPRELERAVSTFNNIQLIDEHRPVSSDRPGAHLPNLTIGSTGTDAIYEHPYLDNSLVIWDRDAINDVERNRRRQLSCAYRYKPDMTPGVYDGQPYDGVMRDISANHLCLVREGRAGSDVIIGDSKMMSTWRSPRFTVAMAQDGALDRAGPWKRMAGDVGTSEGARKAAATRHLHMTATPSNSGRAAHRTAASSGAEVENHLSSLHEYVKKNNLPAHNVTIENKNTGEVHHATVHPNGIKRGYAPGSF
jgi:8-oxo-dGTP pyrophosphatase MutT (NUDIX family)